MIISDNVRVKIYKRNEFSPSVQNKMILTYFCTLILPLQGFLILTTALRLLVY